jgi:hypothetical protein
LKAGPIVVQVADLYDVLGLSSDVSSFYRELLKRAVIAEGSAETHLLHGVLTKIRAVFAVSLRVETRWHQALEVVRIVLLLAPGIPEKGTSSFTLLMCPPPCSICSVAARRSLSTS